MWVNPRFDLGPVDSRLFYEVALTRIYVPKVDHHVCRRWAQKNIHIHSLCTINQTGERLSICPCNMAWWMFNLFSV